MHTLCQFCLIHHTYFVVWWLKELSIELDHLFVEVRLLKKKFIFIFISINQPWQICSLTVLQLCHTVDQATLDLDWDMYNLEALATRHIQHWQQ